MKRILHLLAFGLLLPAISCNSKNELNQRRLVDGFENPPAQARPFVRWWWNGNCVTEKEILRQLDILSAAGVGGVEINPIAMPEEAAKTDAEAILWLSPQWNQMLKTAVEGARRRGMIADMILGSGWPFGGGFLELEETIQAVGYNKKILHGPREFKGNVQDLIEIPEAEFGYKGRQFGDILFVMLAPEHPESMAACVDMKEKIQKDGSLEFSIPEGKHVLYIGIVQKAFRQVMFGAPGADGPVLDHYNRASVEHYLKRSSETLSPYFQGSLGNGFRAVFCDSIELSKANWTAAMQDEFQERCGYNILPWLPFVLQEDKLLADGVFRDQVRRARYDFSRTLCGLYNENFVIPFHNWCRANNTKSRYQAYGYPWLMGMLDGYMVPDIPEGDTWLFNDWMDMDLIRYAVWNKYAASGAHLTGKPLVGCEAMTNTKGVFSASLEYIKQASDLTFISGCNHFILHGFNYSPPEAGIPGWVRFGTYFSEHNPWWPYFKYWADYNSRISWVLQESRPVVQVAILGPSADVWSRDGLEREPFMLTPDYLHYLWQPIHNNGCSADYVNETVLKQAEFKNGRLCFGPMQYDLLVLASVKTLDPETAEAVYEFAKAGGKIAFIEHLPDRSAGFIDAEKNDRKVRDAIQKTLEVGGQRTVRLEKPQSDTMIDWADDLLTRFDISRSVVLKKKDKRLFQIHHRQGVRDIYFFSNQNRDKTLSFDAVFPVNGKTAWRWDPQTAARSSVVSVSNTVSVVLEPLESLLLVFEPQQNLKNAASAASLPKEHAVFPIGGPWAVKLDSMNGDSFDITMDKLLDLSKNTNDHLRNFAGTITYTKEFENSGKDISAIDLGIVYGVSDVMLNGEHLGVRWWGRHRYDVPALKLGRNTLVIKVATVPFNYIQSLKQDALAQQWTKNQNLQPCGLIGPVELISPLEHTEKKH